jgi:hypothetical protein
LLVRIVGAAIVAVGNAVVVRVDIRDAASTPTGQELGRVEGAAVVAVGGAVAVEVAVENATATHARVQLLRVLGTEVRMRLLRGVPRIAAARAQRLENVLATGDGEGESSNEGEMESSVAGHRCSSGFDVQTIHEASSAPSILDDKSAFIQ